MSHFTSLHFFENMQFAQLSLVLAIWIEDWTSVKHLCFWRQALGHEIHRHFIADLKVRKRRQKRSKVTKLKVTTCGDSKRLVHIDEFLLSKQVSISFPLVKFITSCFLMFTSWCLKVLQASQKAFRFALEAGSWSTGTCAFRTLTFFLCAFFSAKMSHWLMNLHQAKPAKIAKNAIKAAFFTYSYCCLYSHKYNKFEASCSRARTWWDSSQAKKVQHGKPWNVKVTFQSFRLNSIPPGAPGTHNVAEVQRKTASKFRVFTWQTHRAQIAKE